MNYSVSFSVGLVHDIYRPGEVNVESVTLFKRIKKMVPGSTPKNEFIYNVCAEWTDPGLHEAFDLLLSATNKRPVADSFYPHHHIETHYSVQVERIVSEEDLNQSSWLLLLPGKSNMTGHCEVSADGTYLIPGVVRAKKISYGTDYLGWTQLFTAPLKDLLVQSGLKIDFRSVKLKKGGESGLWQLQSNLKLPPLSMFLAKQNTFYEPFDGDHAKEGCLVLDGRYYPLVLRYRKQDADKMDDFDVAFTREKSRFPHQLHPWIVVSQQFRKAADQIAPGQFRYTPVVVSEGEDLRTRYTIPELAPPQ